MPSEPSYFEQTIEPLMSYPADVFFDIETLVNVAQADNILLLGDIEADFLNDYKQQKSVLNHDVSITHIRAKDIDQLWQLEQRFDVAIAVDLFEHLSKVKGQQTLSRLRDVLSPQYCICLPLSKQVSKDQWHLTDLFSFALSKVSSYDAKPNHYGLFKYNIKDYKKTPDWLNADNWANPNMWGKYWW